MPRPKRLSGVEIVRVFEKFGFVVVNQHGSHIKLVRNGTLGKERLLVPNHAELKTGTVVGIYKQALRYILESELRPHFYSE